MNDTQGYAAKGNVIYQTLNNETIIINLDNGRYYSLNPTASFIWDSLAQNATVQEIGAAFSPNGNGNASAPSDAIALFVQQLLEQELVAPVAIPPRAPFALDAAATKFETPQMEIFTDMENLIPLDPIHQVGAMGWPFPAREK